MTNISSGDIIVKIGNSVNLLCSAEGEPPISFRWEKDNKAMKSFSRTEKPYHSSTLFVRVKDQSDFGEYTCHIQDRFTTVSHTIRLLNISGNQTIHTVYNYTSNEGACFFKTNSLNQFGVIDKCTQMNSRDIYSLQLALISKFTMDSYLKREIA